MITSFHCNYTYQQVAGTLDSYPTPLAADCVVTGSTTPATSSPVVVNGGYDGLNRSESLLLFMVLIFFVSLASWSRFSIVKKYDTHS